jgi:hypothetical protein
MKGVLGVVQSGNRLMGKSLLYYVLFNEVSGHLNIYLISRMNGE